MFRLHVLTKQKQTSQLFFTSSCSFTIAAICDGLATQHYGVGESINQRHARRQTWPLPILRCNGQVTHAHTRRSTDVPACAKHCNLVRASQGTLGKFSVCEMTFDATWLEDHCTCQHIACCPCVLLLYWCFRTLPFWLKLFAELCMATWRGPARLHVLIENQIQKAKHCQEHKLVNSGDRKLVTLFGLVFLGFSVRHVLLSSFVYRNLVFNLV